MVTKFEDKIGYNSACIRDIFEIVASNGVLRVGQLNDVSQIVPQPTLVALATKFGKFYDKSRL